MSATEVVRARIDPKLKKNATAVLAKMGLSVSDAIRLMLVRVVSERALPFDVSIPNRGTQDAIRAAERGEVASFGSIDDLLADLNDEKPKS
jgi:DNA-damage-inducible protein J